MLIPKANSLHVVHLNCIFQKSNQTSQAANKRDLSSVQTGCCQVATADRATGPSAGSCSSENNEGFAVSADQLSTERLHTCNRSSETMVMSMV